MNSGSNTKTILFWFSIILLGIMLWKLVSNKGPSADSVSYSDFLQLVGKNEIPDARIYLEPNSVTVNAARRNSQRHVATTLSYGDLQDLKERLIDSGAKVEYANQRSGDWVLLLLNGMPLLLLVGFCLFLMRQMRSRGAQALATRGPGVRFGLGYDLHRLDAGRPFIVGGVEIPFDKGPLGHSDGDVLAHAICDAVLGAAGAGDIGTLFPDTDPQWKGVSSLIFLEQLAKVLQDRKQSIGYIDAVVITEKPKLGPHFAAMKATLAKSLKIKPEQISLKAKTNEGVDAIGRGEAIAAHVVATLVSC
ncbi:MAG: 2-C-methyl-D-erythritol 2,4-cyclodiphosphate synthase [Acidobacteria bacterium]|nr:MAG: 2-C-methyl-D-erythritol 2,4-cyclodiphosphate synthase [Acidobacteriota bacterium]